MNASFLINTLVGAVLLPPLNFAILCGIGLLMRRRWPRLGLFIGMGALALLVVFSTPAGARLLLAPLEAMTAPLEDAAQANAGAIVVVGGGRIRNAPEFGGTDILRPIAHLRVHYAAWLHRASGVPILTSGGVPDGAQESEGALMARVLQQHYGVRVRWTEERSNNTAQNAQYSAQMLIPSGIRRILLVTDATHMPRAQAIFRHAGFDVVPAPTLFLTRAEMDVIDFIPGGEGLRRTHYAMHEWIGMLWYKLQYGM